MSQRADTLFKRLRHAVPASGRNIRRLNRLYKNLDESLRIAVLGKYNHGKSTFLNALVRNEVFRVADKRETTEIAEHEYGGVVYIDTPGLDGDPEVSDDRKAWRAAFQSADFLFLVHQAQAGELDRYEINAFLQLARQDGNYSKKMHLVLTQIDQCEPDEVRTVERKIRGQLISAIDLRELSITPVSATRHQKGVNNRNSKLREMSGMAPIFATVRRIKSEVPSLRRREVRRLADKILVDLDDALTETNENARQAKFRLKSDAQRIVESLNPMIVIGIVSVIHKAMIDIIGTQGGTSS